jgi:uncharacterized protein
VDEPPRVAITGASGLVGTALTRSLEAAGGRVVRLVRSRERAGEGAVYWDPDQGVVDTEGLDGVHAVVHLAGENLASARWTAERKARILRSRVEGTRLLCEALASLPRRSSVLVSASAVGYYGDQGDRELDEASPPGDGFLAHVCQQWEAATEAAPGAGIRVVRLRIGVVLSPDGGALARMLPFFKLGLGGRIGRGRQYMSWIHIDDLVAAILHCLTGDGLAGAVNAVAPEPVTNADFTRALGAALHRPAVLPVPPLALSALYGRGLVREALVGGQRVLPRRLAETGFQWRYPQLDVALRHALDV